MPDLPPVFQRLPKPTLRQALLVLLVIAVLAVAAKLFFRADKELEAERPVDGSQAANAHVGPETGLPLPRFVSLGSDKVNVRTGPGPRYPIAWVYVRRDLPVEVVAEYEYYRKIRDWDGAEGWVHKNLISGRRTMLVIGSAVEALRSRPAATAETKALLEPGVVGRLLHCRGAWCEVSVQDHDGYLPRADLYGTLPGEDVN